MIINKYRAKNLRTAIQKAKDDLGPDARMIYLRELDNGEEKVEIIATIDDEMIVHNILEAEDTISEQNIMNYHSAYDTDNDVILSKSALAKANNIKVEKSEKRTNEDIQGFDMIVNDTDKIGSEDDRMQLVENSPYHSSAYVKAFKNRMLSSRAEQVSKKSVKDNRRILQLLHNCCIRNQVDKDITYEILSLLNDDMNAGTSDHHKPSQSDTLRDYISLFINKRIRVSGGLDADKKTAMLIGPTGVGKTTTLAKLAAQYHFHKAKTVGLITIDAYRIAAIEQIKTYAKIMDIPFKVALTPEELKSAIKSYEGLDLILIDTPGRSQYNTKALNSLRKFLEAAQPADIHLLISVTMKEDDAIHTLENFAPEYVQQLIFTKLDETSSFGTILNMGRKSGKPISYLTIGQNVPDDIEAASFDHMVDLFLDGHNDVKTI